MSGHIPATNPAINSKSGQVYIVRGKWVGSVFDGRHVSCHFLMTLTECKDVCAVTRVACKCCAACTPVVRCLTETLYSLSMIVFKCLTVEKKEAALCGGETEKQL